ncbi:MAG: hypothetical protein ACREJC_10925 [Tepidisphaeraceae bacterium]
MLPDKDHPLWKLAQSLVALAGIGLLVIHSLYGGHAGLDLSDAAGAGGGLLGAKLIYQILKG